MARKRRQEPKTLSEADWLNSQDPKVLLFHVKDATSSRKLRLIAAATARRIGHLFRPEVSRMAADIAERYADGEIGDEKLQTARTMVGNTSEGEYTLAAGVRLWDDTAAAWAGWAILHVLSNDEAIRFDGGGYVAHHAAEAVYSGGYLAARTNDRRAFEAGQAARTAEVAAQVRVIRDVVGNPFRPVVLGPELLAWNGGLIPKLDQAIYEERAFERLPILGDALEEAGCAAPNVLSHCREEGEHVPGCWVLDLCLGRK